MPATKARPAGFLAIIYFASLVARLIPVLLTANLPIGLDDMFQYDMLARSLASGTGYRWYAEADLARLRPFLPAQLPADYDPNGIPTSFRAPAYPAFLAIIYLIFGSGPQRFFFARLAQAFLTATIAPLGWWLAIQAGFSDRAARWSAGILAFYPLLVAYTLALATENLFIPLLTLALAFILRVVHRQRQRDALLAGLALGLAALTRSLISGLVPFVILYWWISAGSKRAAIKHCLWFGIGFLIITVPWAARNSTLNQRPTWLETSLGYNLYLGYHPLSQGTFQVKISMDLIPIVDDARRDALGTQAALGFICADPGRVPYLMLHKLAFFWGLDRRALTYFYTSGFFGHWPPLLLGTVMTMDAGPLVALLPLGIIGLLCGKWDKSKVFFAIVLVVFTGFHTLILAEPRFHLPLLSILAVLAAHALCDHAWIDSLIWKRGMAIGLIILAAFNWVIELARDWPLIQLLFGPDGQNLHLSY